MSQYPGGQPPPGGPYYGQPPYEPYAPPPPPPQAEPLLRPASRRESRTRHRNTRIPCYGAAGLLAAGTGLACRGPAPGLLAAAASTTAGGAPRWLTGAAIVGIFLVLVGLWFLFREEIGLDFGRVWPVVAVSLGVLMVLAAFIPRRRA